MARPLKDDCPVKTFFGPRNPDGTAGGAGVAWNKGGEVGLGDMVSGSKSGAV